MQLNNTHKWLAAATLAGLMSVVGCKGPDLVMAPNTTADDPLPTGAYPEIVLLDGLEKRLVKQGIDVQPTSSTTPMTVRALVRSVVDAQTSVQYRFLFFGPGGEPLTRNPVWREKVIQPRTRVTFEANAINMDAVSFELEIRRP
jgi:Protein of unknown function (DUF1425)